MKLVLVPLFILFIASIFNLGTAGGIFATSTPLQNGTNTNPNQGTNSAQSAALSQSLTIGVSVIIGAMIVAILAFGLTVLGSGFSAGTGRVMAMLITLLGLWGLLTITGGSLIQTLPFGIFMYLALSIVYLIGVIQLTSGAGGSE